MSACIMYAYFNISPLTPTPSPNITKPYNLVTFSSIISLKKQLKLHNLSKFLKKDFHLTK